MAKETTDQKVDPTLLTPAEAAKLVEALSALLKSIEGKTGHAANIRLKLEAARDIAGNVK